MDTEERVAVGFLAIIVAGFAASIAFKGFLKSGVDPNVAAGYTVVIFLAVLGAFGVIAVTARL
jgi:hypothetical protein